MVVALPRFLEQRKKVINLSSSAVDEEGRQADHIAQINVVTLFKNKRALFHESR